MNVKQAAVFAILSFCQTVAIATTDAPTAPPDSTRPDNQDSLTSHPGHLKPFGQSGPHVEVEIIENFPQDSSTFLNDYILASKPVVITSGFASSPALHKWSDDYFGEFASKPGPDGSPFEVILEVEKKEDRSSGTATSMPFQKFLEHYNSSTLYMIDHVPYDLASDLVVPCPLQHCGLSLETDSVMMWFSSGNTSSVVHIDSSENFLCVIRGTKEVLLLQPNSVPIGEFSTGVLMVDVDKVDLAQRPLLAGVDFYHASLTPGTCLFIPINWAHQVRSYDSNIGVNFWFPMALNSARWMCSDKKSDEPVCDPNYTVDKLPIYSDADKESEDPLICNTPNEIPLFNDVPPTQGNGRDEL